MIKLKLNNDIWNEVDRRAADLPIFNGSHRKLAANIVGCLGEVVVEMWLDAEEVSITPELTETTHDYRLVNGSTFDVKTKDRTVSPRPYYDCSIPLYNHEHQRPDYYIFVSLERNGSNKDTSAKRYHTAWILGGLDQPQLDKYGKVWRRGDVDPANGTKFWTDCKNVQVSDLMACEDIADIWFSMENEQ